MNKVSNFLLAILLLALLAGCGHKQSPTGGKSDLDKVKILAVTPDEFSNLKDGQIDVTFSKNLDRTKVPTGIYIYPPIDRKRYKFQGNHLIMRIMEPLKDNTNYYFTFTPRIQDERGNSLENNQTLVYASGNLQNHKISGDIILEDETDSKFPINLSLLDQDSLLIFNKVIRGTNYSLENLNPVPHILRAYIDRNLNGKYDFGEDPYTEEKAPANPVSTIDLHMVYADTVKVIMKSANVISNREVELTFSEPVKSYDAVHITANRDNKDLAVLLEKLEGNKLTLLMAVQDTTKYKISIKDLQDGKGNRTAESHLYINGIARADRTAPVVVSTIPRNGTSINELIPDLKVVFSEIIPSNNLKFTFMDTETNSRINAKIVSGNDRVYVFRPEKALQNYHSYKLTISHITSDISGNSLGKDVEVLFLTLIKNGG